MIRNEPTEPKMYRLQILKGILVFLSLLFGVCGMVISVWKLQFVSLFSFLLLGTVCVVLLHFTGTVVKGRLHEVYSLRRIKVVFILSIVIGVIEILPCIYNSYVLGVHLHRGVRLGYNFYFLFISGFLTGAWSFLLAYESRSYMAEFSLSEMAQQTSTLQT